MAEKAVEERTSASSKRERQRRNPFAAFWLFLKQVIGELGKVVTPTRKELLSYTLVVLIFVVIMMALVSGIDFVFGYLVGWVFGDSVPALF